MVVLLAIAVFLGSASVDYAGVRYVHAVSARRVHSASRWSVAQWAAATVGFFVAVKVTMWMLPFEGLGLYVGSWISMRFADAPELDAGS